MAAPYRRRGPEQVYWTWALGLAGAMLALGAALALIFWLENGQELAKVPALLRGRIIFYLVIALGSLLAVAGFALRLFFRRYVFPLDLLGEDLEALLHGAKGVRLGLEEQQHLGHLEYVLNELVQRHEVSEEDIARRLDRELGALNQEKHGLESILEALREGVILCDLSGTVLRYNSAAKRLLDKDGYLGRRRPIFRLIDKALCDYALDAIRSQIAYQVAHPLTHFMVDREGQEPLRIRAAPLQSDGTQLLGFVLSFEDPEQGAPTVRIDQLPRSGESAEPATRPDGHSAALSGLRYVVFDTETTGLEPSRGDEIISIGAVTIVDGHILQNENFDQLVNPGRPLGPESIKVHGITPDMLAEQPDIGTVLGAFSRFAEDAVLVAHNAAFDMRFLKEKELSTGIRLTQPVLDTLLMSAVLHPNQTSHSLDSLIRRYGIENAGRHTALGDALMTAELFLKLLAQLERRGMTQLGEVLDASRKTPLARISF
ncbi:MAG: exonuclease domain-containing protein [SAR324 cluster bacterium]|nr:exonuclease domain-containing protein [SAR324 cluster bacterium]